MSSARRPDLTEEEYLDIEEALASNARGRTFLRMRDQRARVVAVTEVRKLAREIKDGIPKATPAETEAAAGGTDEAHIRILREELREMSAYIHQTRREIAALRPVDGDATRIVAASGELEGIVSATERATSAILSGVERIQALAMKLPKGGEVAPIAQEIQAQVTEVLTACSFQDITGQRSTKVVNTLRYVEQRVNSMLEIWGGEIAASLPPAEIDEPQPETPLLHGPAPEGGPSQADIDALFEELGRATETGKPGKGGKADKPAGEKSKQQASQSQIDAMFNVAE